jgi:hypothetical protein
MMKLFAIVLLGFISGPWIIDQKNIAAPSVMAIVNTGKASPGQPSPAASIARGKSV